jgi:hypothetical protein
MKTTEIDLLRALDDLEEARRQIALYADCDHPELADALRLMTRALAILHAAQRQ